MVLCCTAVGVTAWGCLEPWNVALRDVGIGRWIGGAQRAFPTVMVLFLIVFILLF